MAGGLFLPDEQATLALGRAMAVSLPPGWREPCVLLRAGLGSGKTTLTRGFVQALPGGELAEVASPSFNLANIYPTTPQVVHVDLYRLGEGFMDPGLEEMLDAEPGAGGRVLMVEWSEYLPVRLKPRDRLELELSAVNEGREAGFEAFGPEAARWLDAILSTFSQSGKS